MMKYLMSLFVLLTFTACNSSGPSRDDNIEETSKADYQVLMLGNSHSSANDLPGILRQLVESGTSKTASVALGPGYQFLAERLSDGASEELLKGSAWTHVILQAQKYSTSGLYSYPTDAAKIWIQITKEQNALPIMFPEWPRENNHEEGMRVHLLHHSIASAEPACVAPIGIAWEASLAEKPELRLHASDGNHANLTGSLLTAFVLYEVITEQKAEQLVWQKEIGVAEETQQFLRKIASQAILSHPACPYGDLRP